jgi:hypothetical protein
VQEAAGRCFLQGALCWGVLADSAGNSQQLVASGSWAWLVVPQAGAVVWV